MESFVIRDGKKYTGKEADRIIAREKDEETVSKLKDEVGLGSKLRAYGSDAVDTLSGIVKMDTTGDNRRARRQYEKGKDSYDQARSRLEENNYRKGGLVKKSASRRADGIAQRGKTRGKVI